MIDLIITFLIVWVLVNVAVSAFRLLLKPRRKTPPQERAYSSTYWSSRTTLHPLALTLVFLWMGVFFIKILTASLVGPEARLSYDLAATFVLIAALAMGGILLWKRIDGSGS